MLPLCALLITRHVDGSLRDSRFVLLLGLALAFQFATSTELFASLAVFIGLGLALAFAGLPGRRARIRVTLTRVAFAYVVACAVASPLVYYTVVSAGQRPVNSPDVYSADIVNFLLPTPVTLIGQHEFGRLAASYSGNLFENGAYLGLPLLLIAALYARHASRTGRLVVAFFGIAEVAALGPHLHVAGHSTVPMPWYPLSRLPLMRYALPGRFVAYGSLALAVTVALWLRRASGRWQWVLIAAAGAFLLQVWAVRSGIRPLRCRRSSRRHILRAVSACCSCRMAVRDLACFTSPPPTFASIWRVAGSAFHHPHILRRATE
jgi:hypothetical protein